MHLQPGQRIIAPFLATPAEVKRFETRAGYVLLEVVLGDGHQNYKLLRVTDDQLAQIQVLGGSPVTLTEDVEDFFFLIETHRIRLAYQFDPQLAVSISRVDPLPHQMEAVYRYALESPRIRFLIADEPGRRQGHRGHPGPQGTAIRPDWGDVEGGGVGMKRKRFESIALGSHKVLRHWADHE